MGLRAPPRVDGPPENSTGDQGIDLDLDLDQVDAVLLTRDIQVDRGVMAVGEGTDTEE